MLSKTTILLLILFLHSSLAYAVSIPPLIKIKTPIMVTQPNGRELKLIELRPPSSKQGQQRGVEYLTANGLFIPVLKNKNGYYVLAIFNINSNTEFRKSTPSRYYYHLSPTKIRADSPIALKTKVKGEWRFFLPNGSEIPYYTKKAILPDWPRASIPHFITDCDGVSNGYFHGTFTQDGRPICHLPKQSLTGNKPNFRSPFAGSFDFWLLMIPLFLAWKRYAYKKRQKKTTL